MVIIIIHNVATYRTRIYLIKYYYSNIATKVRFVSVTRPVLLKYTMLSHQQNALYSITPTQVPPPFIIIMQTAICASRA